MKGKSWSRRNALKHGILASELRTQDVDGEEGRAEFDELHSALILDLAPVGMLEELLVEKIAVCWWRQKRALRWEGELASRPSKELINAIKEGNEIFRRAGIGEVEIDEKMDSWAGYAKDRPSLHSGAEMDRILRYETTIQRQLVYAINQLERLQRARKGEHVPAPVSVQVSSDQ